MTCTCWNPALKDTCPVHSPHNALTATQQLAAYMDTLPKDDQHRLSLNDTLDRYWTNLLDIIHPTCGQPIRHHHIPIPPGQPMTCPNPTDDQP